MMQQDDDAVVERFPPTSGRFSGILGLLTAGLVIVLAVFAWEAGTALGVGILGALGAVLVWAALLRPALWVTSHDLVMRGMFHTDRVPLAAIDGVRITQVLTVTVGGRSMVSPVVGYSLRQLTKRRMQTRAGLEQPNLQALEPRTDGPRRAAGAGGHQEFVEARLTHLAQSARDQAGIEKGSAEQAALAADVRRTWAWPEIVAVAVLTAAFLVWLAL